MSDLWIDHISFTQLSLAQDCPYSYYLQKIAKVNLVENAFSQAGALAHKLLAGWAKGEIRKEDLPLNWVQLFPKTVTAEFPYFLASKGYAGKLFDCILTYFENFDGFPGFEIVGVEKEFSSSIADERFTGVIDLILKNKETGRMMIVDHKSCSMSSFRKSKEHMYRQLLLYSKYCADTYGEFPETLRFNLFKENTYDERQFDREDFIATRLWAESIVKELKTKDVLDWFEVNPEFFRCTNLCSCRTNCIFGKPENHKRKDETNGTRCIPIVA